MCSTRLQDLTTLLNTFTPQRRTGPGRRYTDLAAALWRYQGSHRAANAPHFFADSDQSCPESPAFFDQLSINFDQSIPNRPPPSSPPQSAANPRRCWARGSFPFLAPDPELITTPHDFGIFFRQ